MVSGFEHGQLVLQSDGTWHEWGGETNGFAYPTFSTHARRVMRFDADGVLSPLLQLKKIASEARELLYLVASACDNFFFLPFFYIRSRTQQPELEQDQDLFRSAFLHSTTVLPKKGEIESE